MCLGFIPTTFQNCKIYVNIESNHFEQCLNNICLGKALEEVFVSNLAHNILIIFKLIIKIFEKKNIYIFLVKRAF
ncbi:hypothetical protein PNEG_04311 [Pneumocystis murina B123]|uniref:Uncharacterized protein n=1 Tax=Pneumocystis murina (strain B123) TaxID=1069680 RepID=A0A0W4ZWY6_PNEMU|nr:hypothetical protein PNEG_04311 [Pneumocystis murina B123]KTW32880.1 hypothetical protein PNEG_04311 [Pneumocystis murina B123]